MQDNFDEMMSKPTENGEPPKFKVLTEIQAGSVTETDTIDEIEKIEAIDRELEKQQAQAKPEYTFTGYSDFSAAQPATNISYAPPPPPM